MYLYEWGFQWSKKLMTYEESIEAAKKRQGQPGLTELNAPDGIQESVSKSVYDNDSLYAYNDTYIDLRTPNDEKRGLITIFLGGIGWLVFYPLVATAYISITRIFAGFYSVEDPINWSEYFFLIGFPLFFWGMLFIYLKYAFRYLRLESFTARRIIVRFNRITRKVYLLRPKYLGGIRIMDWDKAEVVIDKNMTELDGTGGFVIVAWDKSNGADQQGNPTDDMEAAFVGKPTRNASELLAFWEYIRRYMEDGPAAAPPPKKLISKFPWPWNSFKAAWGLDTRFLQHSGLWVFVLINVLLLPVVLIHGTGHWLSLLLCYEPRFPRVIEEAGR
ncbi:MULTISPECIES: DUF6708 domain-containing protein [unclassified Pseudomonas]|uniref:DUF6708 domain-containing protein n=1 Tax=unclassified Pseudomonas TaxID=196821 RepID=UPI00099607C8|nr:DUF6708 domain-containing protein [Pseudomonas sp. MF4836]OOV89368.1 hypothetical protein MF4836_33445 [Pseudomonas sp. MF4836]